jgi:hypothetical protein
MRTTRLHATLLPLAALLALPSVTNAANCYSIYDAKNQLTFQSTVPPIDLSTRISQAMRERFPGGFLVIVPDDGDCREFRTGSLVSPRFDSGKAPESPGEVMQAPLLRGAGPANIVGDGAGTGAATSSGNNLRIRRP